MSTRCHSLSFVVTRCHSLYHSMSLVVLLAAIRCPSLSLDVPLVCLFINDRDRQQAYFQIQFIEVTVRSEIYLQYARNVKLEHDREHSADINKMQQVYYSNLKGPPQIVRSIRTKGNRAN